MYSYEERMKAVMLYIKYGKSPTRVVKELGYPNKRSLVLWYKEFEDSGNLHSKYIKQPRYSAEQIETAVKHFLEHGRNISYTAKQLGYPSRPTLREWIDEYDPTLRNSPLQGKTMLQYPYEQKVNAVIEFCTREGSGEAISDRTGVSRRSLYSWRNQLLSDEEIATMNPSNKPALPDDTESLKAINEELKKQIYHQQMEIDILLKAAEIIKKEKGISLLMLTNKEKFSLIDALRESYSLNDLLLFLQMAKSSYFYQRSANDKADKYSEERLKIKSIFIENKSRYGYRRIHAILKSTGDIVSEKVVHRLMREEELVIPKKEKRKYSSYFGEVSPAVDNIICRDFSASLPNEKWLTDLTEFHIPAGKVYLSPIIDCFDGIAVSWTIGTSPNADLVNLMLDNAISTLSTQESPLVHTDRGAHYRWPGWISRMNDAGLIRSMSKKGCSPDNSACEGFFGILKNEMFYNRSWQGVTIEQFIHELNEYISWHNEKRIKMSLGGMSPMDYRKSLGLAA